MEKVFNLVLRTTSFAVFFNTSQPAYLLSLLSYHIPACAPPTPLSLLTSSLFLATISLHVLLQHQSVVGSSGSTQPLLAAVSALLPPQYGTHSLLVFMLVCHHNTSCRLLKTHCPDQAFSSP